jgi:hypothetical protein
MRVDRGMLPMSAAGASRVRSQSSKRQLRLTAADAYAYSGQSAPRGELVERPQYGPPVVTRCCPRNLRSTSFTVAGGEAGLGGDITRRQRPGLEHREHDPGCGADRDGAGLPRRLCGRPDKRHAAHRRPRPPAKSAVGDFLAVVADPKES